MSKFSLQSAEVQSLINYLSKHSVVTSWDWNADYAFAVVIGDNESAKIIKQTLDAGCLDAFRIGTWRYCWKKQITEKRLFTLRRMEKSGIIKSNWTGAGFGSYHEFGIRRLRAYQLSDYGKSLAEAQNGNGVLFK